ncbi:GNAT family N-acetyltransferase [Terrimonas pollutisoli]|uniref:GNAT family N-acetyltransferase n=1 Tax=Terrimonas pollutisoli TaxID=3034147 RepID=UPI0023EC7240|nr:GNAT family N-acetyltransferase [Terrimonas sp. H1YJ31]
MKIEVVKTGLEEIKSFRLMFLQENNFQFIHDKCHYYGWADTYLFLRDDIKIGYGSIWGKDKREDRDTIFEFYIIKPYRKLSADIFKQLHAVSSATYIECQTNDLLQTGLLYEHAKEITAEAILFKDHFETNFQMPGMIFQKNIPASSNPNDIQYVLKQQDEVAATGGLMLNYNFPYADIYYEVKEEHRRKGYGSFMIQELKKAAYEMGRVPAARCNIKNRVSKAALLKGGLTVCGYLLTGKIS